METVVSHKENTTKESNEHSRASTAVQIVRSEHGLTTIPVGGEGLSVVLLAMKDQKEKERKRRQPLEQALSEQFSIDKEMEQSVDKRYRGILDISKDSSAIDTVPKKHSRRGDEKPLFHMKEQEVKKCKQQMSLLCRHQQM